MTLALHLCLMAVAGVLVWKGSDGLASASASLARRYRLPPLVEGTILVAVGSSLPEMTTTVLSALVHDDFDLGISVVVGSAIFNILVIPGVSAMSAGRLEAGLLLVYRDAQFYLMSIAVLMLAFSFAVIYAPVEGEGIRGEVSRGIALVPLGLYLLYLFLQQRETVEHRAEASEPTPDDADDVPPGRAWLLLLGGLAMILVGVEGLLRGAIFLGEHFGTPSFLWGVTVVAAVTSVPDAFVSVKVARDGRGTVSLANVFGSNIVDLLVAIPLGVLVAGSSPVDYGVAIPLIAFLTGSTILLFALLRRALELTRIEAIILLAVYAAFITWMLLETLDVTGLIPDA